MAKSILQIYSLFRPCHSSKTCRYRRKGILHASTLCIAFAFAWWGCGSDRVTMEDRAPTPCLQAIPACPQKFAACVLDQTRYARVQLPNRFLFMANADAGEVIRVLMYITKPQNSGKSTWIAWNEPGCSRTYRYSSDGLDLFRVAEDTGGIEEERTMAESGDHLIEIGSDMTAEILVSVDVFPKGSQ